MWGPTDDREAVRALRRAVELGVNFIDTAFVYGEGHSEELIAEALGAHPPSVYIATKVPPKNMEWPARHDVPVTDAFPGAWITECTEQSLRRLRRETVDLQQFHVWSPRWFAEREAWVPAVEQLKRVRYFWRQAHWLTERFPKAKLCDVEGLVKLVDRAKIEANDWSLTPGRYVGVAPEETDEDFDFEETLREIHVELNDLNSEAITLAETIKKNFEALGI